MKARQNLLAVRSRAIFPREDESRAFAFKSNPLCPSALYLTRGVSRAVRKISVSSTFYTKSRLYGESMYVCKSIVQIDRLRLSRYSFLHTKVHLGKDR